MNCGLEVSVNKTGWEEMGIWGCEAGRVTMDKTDIEGKSDLTVFAALWIAAF